ncbi:MAG: hypothetical protein WCP46_07775, partial [Alphaproteobacteria bacterium]
FTSLHSLLFWAWGPTRPKKLRFPPHRAPQQNHAVALNFAKLWLKQCILYLKISSLIKVVLYSAYDIGRPAL